MVRFGQKTAPVCQGESGHSGAKITRLGRPGLFPFREAERIYLFSIQNLKENMAQSSLRRLKIGRNGLFIHNPICNCLICPKGE
jgi:hypothetical protein